MTATEQQIVKDEYYNEAIRYMENAKEILKKAGKEDNHYQDEKYVKTACGLAYNAVLVALKGLFILKDIPKPKNRAKREYYEDNLAKFDKKLLKYYNEVYNILHLSGYYDGVTNVKVVSSGFEEAYLIINKLK